MICTKTRSAKAISYSALRIQCNYTSEKAEGVSKQAHPLFISDTVRRLSMQPFPSSSILKTPNSSHELFLSVCFPYKFGQGVA